MLIGFENHTSTTPYRESGMWFENFYGGPEVLHLATSGWAGYPDDGTQYLQMTAGTGLAFAFSPYTAFGLVSMDVAEYATALPGPVTLHVVGYISGGQGQTVSTDLTTDGIIDGPGGLPDFQTFTFDNRFRNLYRVEVLSDHWSIDNVVVSGIPEPSTGALVLLGAACALGRSRIKRRTP